MESKVFAEDLEVAEECCLSSPLPPPYNPESTRSNTPPAYNPGFVASQSPSCNDPSCRSAASPPAQIKTIDPMIASILQQGFPPEYVQRETSQKSSPDSEHELPKDIEYVIVEEAFVVPTATNEECNPSFPVKIKPGTKANPPGAPRRIRLSHERYKYENFWPYAQLLAWKTSRMSKAALRKALRLKSKHTPQVKAMVKRSATLVKETSQKSLEMVKVHAPKIKEHVQRASVSTANSIRGLEDKHQVWAKSKRGVKHGSRAMQEVWTKRHARVY